MRSVLSEKTANQQNIGKLSRQMGTTNLLKKSNPENNSFKVFEERPNSSNGSFIQEIEKKLQEKKDAVDEPAHNQPKLSFKLNHPNAKQLLDAVYQKTRQKEDIESIADDCSTAAPSVCSFYTNDKKFYDEVPSATSSIRANFAQFDMREDAPLRPMDFDEFKDADLGTEYTQKKLNKEQRDELMYSSEEYLDDIYNYMCHRQTIVRASSLYFKKQPEVTPEMRSIMLDWFHDVCGEYGLSQQTFHLGASLVDRVLSQFYVQKSRFQLVGSTCLMIASKFEEVYAPDVKEFAQITDDAFTVDQILHMEKYLLSQLDYTVSTPTFCWFAQMYAAKQKADKRTTNLAAYLVDIALSDAEMLQFRRQYVAAAALVYANILLGQEPWNETMREFSKISLASMNKIVILLHRKFSSGTIQDAHPSVYEKYLSTDCCEVALIQPALCDIEAVLGLKETCL